MSWDANTYVIKFAENIILSHMIIIPRACVWTTVDTAAYLEQAKFYIFPHLANLS